MASRIVQFIVHPALGGMNTQAAPTLLAPDQLIEARNIHYKSDGSRQKRGDQSHLNTSTVGSSVIVRGASDFWRDDGSGDFTQKLVIYADTKVSTIASGGSVTDIKTGLQADKIPGFAAMNGLLVIGLNGTDVPMSWDQTTFQNLAGSPPNSAQFVKHRGRIFTWGIHATPSRLQ